LKEEHSLGNPRCFHFLQESYINESNVGVDEFAFRFQNGVHVGTYAEESEVHDLNPVGSGQAVRTGVYLGFSSLNAHWSN
jgi:hypothetical protein